MIKALVITTPIIGLISATLTNKDGHESKKSSRIRHKISHSMEMPA